VITSQSTKRANRHWHRKLNEQIKTAKDRPKKAQETKKETHNSSRSLQTFRPQSSTEARSLHSTIF